MAFTTNWYQHWDQLPNNTGGRTNALLSWYVCNNIPPSGFDPNQFVADCQAFHSSTLLWGVSQPYDTSGIKYFGRGFSQHLFGNLLQVENLNYDVLFPYAECLPLKNGAIIQRLLGFGDGSVRGSFAVGPIALSNVVDGHLSNSFIEAWQAQLSNYYLGFTSQGCVARPLIASYARPTVTWHLGQIIVTGRLGVCRRRCRTGTGGPTYWPPKTPP
jgi:hypothetical protein